MPLMYAATICPTDDELVFQVWFHQPGDDPAMGFVAGEATSVDEAKRMLENNSQVWCIDIVESENQIERNDDGQDDFQGSSEK